MEVLLQRLRDLGFSDLSKMPEFAKVMAAEYGLVYLPNHGVFRERPRKVEVPRKGKVFVPGGKVYFLVQEVKSVTDKALTDYLAKEIDPHLTDYFERTRENINCRGLILEHSNGSDKKRYLVLMLKPRSPPIKN